MSKNFIFSSESVGEGHPDKVCDTISDAVLDACLQRDRGARVAVETAIKNDEVWVFGELSLKDDASSSSPLDFAAIELTTNLQDGLTGEITGENKTGWDFIEKSATAFDVSPLAANGPAFHPDHFYLAIDGILGDNLSVERGGWFDVLDYSISFDNTGTAKIAGGGGAGRPEFGNLNITIDSDYGLTALLDTISTGGAAKLVNAPPIDTLTNNTAMVAYLMRVEMFCANTPSRSISAAMVMAAGSVMMEPSIGTRDRLRKNIARLR